MPCELEVEELHLQGALAGGASLRGALDAWSARRCCRLVAFSNANAKSALRALVDRRAWLAARLIDSRSSVGETQ
jgi:hypothetical protein